MSTALGLRYNFVMQKQSIWIVWIASVAAMLVGSGWVLTVGKWTFGLMFVAHVVEFFMNRSLFEKAGGSMGNHFMQTLIYGFLYWTPIKKRLESE
jgi:membrane protein DedA with SNARE-associated domain